MATTGAAGAGSGDAAAAALSEMLVTSHLLSAEEIPGLARRYAPAFGGIDAVCYLADLQQTILRPFLGLDGAAIAEQAEPLLVDTTLAGRAFQHIRIMIQKQGPAGVTMWLPLLDGSERLGVLAVLFDGDAPETDGPALARLRAFASLLAELVMTKTSYGDTIVRLRREADMGLAAEMQWSMLPPLTFACPAVTVAAALEPAYQVAGDTFDYAVDSGVARVAVFDAMGHGLTSAQVAAMTLAVYRHARRQSRTLLETCAEIDETLLGSFGGKTFTTALLTELDTDLGVLRWVNAGHPEPLLLRHGRLVKSLQSSVRPPLGLHLGASAVPVPSVGSEHLERGDCVLLYTDGVTEARSPDGEFFGVQRLVDLVVRNLATGLSAPETVRRVVRALLHHQQGQLSDDASLALVQWHTDTEAFTVTAPGLATV